MTKYKRHNRVGVDCRDLLIAKTGSKTYLAELLSAAEDLGSDEITFMPLRPFIQIIKLRGKVGKLLMHIQFIFWKQITLPLLAKFNKCDLLLCTDYFLPSLKFGLKHVVVFHDAFFWEYPSHYNQLWLKLFHEWAVPAAKRAEAILVPSSYTKQNILQRMHVDDGKVHVVYEAPKSFLENKGIVNLGKENNNETHYLLHVGVLSKHKNLPFLIRAFKLAIQHGDNVWKLILVGGKVHSIADDDFSSIKSTIQELGLENQVILKGYLKDEEVAHYYRNASGYVFPSYNEGFGLPMLEAMRFNLPIAAANNTCLPEIGKDAAIYFNPFNMDELVHALHKLMQRDGEVLKSIEHQHDVLSKYSWKQAALEITAICKDLVS